MELTVEQRLAELRLQARRLTLLLEDPEPGLMTWQEALRACIGRLDDLC